MYIPEIRFCDFADLPAILELNAASPWPWPDEVIREDLEAGSEMEITYLGAFTTTQSPRLLGYAALGRERSAGLLMGFVVHARYRRRGIGLQLLAAAGDCAVYLGFKRLRLRVRRSNAPALALYRRMSFTQDGVERGYYSDGEDALSMSAPLPFRAFREG